MNEALVKERVATATSNLAARFERFLEDNRALLTEDTEQQLGQVISDLRQTRSLLGVRSDEQSPSEVDLLSEFLESYASQFDDKDTFVENVACVAVSSFDSAHDR